jgi:hypothetical protein
MGNILQRNQKGGFKMKKIFLGISILFFLSSTIKAQDTLVRWTPERILSWDDFQEISDSLKNADAWISRGINFTCSDDQVMITKLEIFAFFIPEESMVRDTSKNLLDHEQTHFNISEYFVRLIRKQIQIFIDTSDALITCNELYEIFNAINSKEEEFQKKYDIETDYSKNEEKQKEWSQKVLFLLEETKEYAEPIELYEW